MSRLDDILSSGFFGAFKPTELEQELTDLLKIDVKNLIIEMVDECITPRSHAGEKRDLLDRIEQL